MLRFVGQFPEFVVPITSAHLKRSCVYIPQRFTRKFGEDVRPEASIFVKNGDIFDVIYSAEKSCFVGLNEISERYSLSSFSHLVFQYQGDSKFAMAVINTCGVEIEYPSECAKIKCKMPLNFEVLSMKEVNLLDDESDEWTFADQLNAAVLSYNTAQSRGKQIEMEFCVEHITKFQTGVHIGSVEELRSHELPDGEYLSLDVFGNVWEVKVCQLNGNWYLLDGWSNFATAAQIEVGDMCVLKWKGIGKGYTVALFQKYSTVGQTIQRGRGHCRPKLFLRQVSRPLLKTFSFVVPMVYVERYQHAIPKEVIVRVANTEMEFTTNYDRTTHKFTGLQSLLSSLRCKVTDILVFQFLGRGVFELKLYKL